MSEKMFPIQSQRNYKGEAYPLSIPWSVAALAYTVYSNRYGRGQSLERLAERGGFGPGEMDDFLPDWRARCCRIVSLESELQRLRKIIGDIETIRADEGNSVTICCDNPEAESVDAQCAVDVIADFTNWQEKRYLAKDWSTALADAATAARQFNIQTKNEIA